MITIAKTEDVEAYASTLPDYLAGAFRDSCAILLTTDSSIPSNTDPSIYINTIYREDSDSTSTSTDLPMESGDLYKQEERIKEYSIIRDPRFALMSGAKADDDDPYDGYAISGLEKHLVAILKDAKLPTTTDGRLAPKYVILINAPVTYQGKSYPSPVELYEKATTFRFWLSKRLAPHFLSLEKPNVASLVNCVRSYRSNFYGTGYYTWLDAIEQVGRPTLEKDPQGYHAAIGGSSYYGRTSEEALFNYLHYRNMDL